MQHRRAVHEGIKYPCGQCEYQATSKRNLDQHKKSVHEGIKYPCEQCELYADIAHKDSLFLHEQLFCVLQDVLLLLLDTHIVYKDILFPVSYTHLTLPTNREV